MNTRFNEVEARSNSKRNLTMSSVIGGLAAVFMAASPLHAGELSAMAGETIDLGRFQGVVYFTSENDSYRVVATISDGEAGLPVRFSATLADNQSATISVPGKVGEAGRSFEIARSGHKVVLTEAGTNDAARPEM
jgi:hypothetical protein